MGGFFSKPKKPKPDPNQQRLIEQQREEMARQDAEMEERKAARRRFSRGRASLLSGSETGVPSRETLG